MDFGLDDDLDLLVSSVRRYVEKEIKPAAADADRAGKISDTVLRSAGDLGFLLDAVPEKHGGLCEESYSHLARALRGFELGRGCSAHAALLESNVEPALAVTRWGSETAQRTFFGSLGDGRLSSYYRDSAGRLTITLRGDALEVSGQTSVIPGLSRSEYVLCAGDASGTPVLFLVPCKNATSVTPSGWRAAAWGSLTLSQHKVAPEWILRSGPDAAKAIAEIHSWYRVSLAARATGVARAAIVFARSYGEERVQFGQPIGHFESLKQICDDNETLIEAAWLFTRKAAWQIDKGHAEAGDSASRARSLAAQVVSRATIDAVQVHGGYGFVNDFPVEKLMRDATAYAVLGGEEGTFRIMGDAGKDGHGHIS